MQIFLFLLSKVNKFVIIKLEEILNLYIIPQGLEVATMEGSSNGI